MAFKWMVEGSLNTNSRWPGNSFSHQWQWHLQEPQWALPLKVAHEGTWAFGILTLNGQRKQRVQWRLSWPPKQWLKGREHRWGSTSRRLQCLVGKHSCHWFQSSRQRNPVCRLSDPEPGDSHCAPCSIDQTFSYSCLFTVPPTSLSPTIPQHAVCIEILHWNLLRDPTCSLSSLAQVASVLR